MAASKKYVSEKNDSETNYIIRQHPRKFCSETTFYAKEFGVYEGLIENIGKKGVFIKTGEEVATGDVITVAVPSSGSGTGIKIRGEIVWKASNGFGVNFKKSLNPKRLKTPDINNV